jgi:hypothetical protein
MNRKGQTSIAIALIVTLLVLSIAIPIGLWISNAVFPTAQLGPTWTGYTDYETVVVSTSNTTTLTYGAVQNASMTVTLNQTNKYGQTSLTQNLNFTLSSAGTPGTGGQVTFVDLNATKTYNCTIGYYFQVNYNTQSTFNSTMTTLSNNIWASYSLSTILPIIAVAGVIIAAITGFIVWRRKQG